MCGLSAKNQDSPDSLLLSFLAGGSGGGGFGLIPSCLRHCCGRIPLSPT